MARFTSLLALSAAVLVGCGTASPSASATPAVGGPLAPGVPQLAEGVVAMENLCVEGAEERCDALDSDCDGRIDEGCEGAAEGVIVVAVAWNGPAALAIELEGAGADDASMLDAGCDGPRMTRATVDQAQAGRLAVQLRRSDACGDEGAVTASVTLSVEGRVLGTFNRSVEGGPVPIVAVDLTR